MLLLPVSQDCLEDRLNSWRWRKGREEHEVLQSPRPPTGPVQPQLLVPPAMLTFLKT